MSDFLSGMGLRDEDLEETRETMRRASRRSERDGRVCLCGHPMRRHHNTYGLQTCEPSRMRCECARALAVLEVSDTRPWIAKTEGPGVLHALLKGFVAAQSAASRSGKEITAEWVVEVSCHGCGSSEDVVPASVDAAGMISDKSEKLNVLACGKCIEKMSRETE